MGVECQPAGHQHQCWPVAEVPPKSSHLDPRGTGILKTSKRERGFHIPDSVLVGIGYFFFNLFIFVASGLFAWPGNLQEHFVWGRKVGGGGKRCAFYSEICPMFLHDFCRVSSVKLLKLQIAVWLIQVVTASEAKTVTVWGTENLRV